MVALTPIHEELEIPPPQRRLFLFLLVYRWVSLLPALWLFRASAGEVTPNTSPVILLAIAVNTTLLITIFHRPFNRILLEDPFFLGTDLFCSAVLLTLSGGALSPYFVYALSTLLAAAIFFHIRGAMLAVGGFTIFYLLTLLIAYRAYPIQITVTGLFTQIAGVWMVTILFGGLSELFKQLRIAHDALAVTRDNLARQNAELAQIHDNLAHQNVELAAAHHQLKVIHDLTLFLQGASDAHSIQQRLLEAVTGELSFPQAVVGLVNPVTQKVERWKAYPLDLHPLPGAVSLPLNAKDGLIAQVIRGRRLRWCAKGEALTSDEILDAWLGPGPWLVLPMILQENPVGVLLVVAEDGPAGLADRLAVLTSVVSQAAVALGTLDRTRRLAVEQERNRIARDIHDTFTQSLFGTVFMLDACVKLLPNEVETVRTELIALRDQAAQMRHEVRRSILDLWPSELTAEKFKADLEKYIAHYSRPRDFCLDFMVDDAFDGLSPAIRRGLYRVTQEALTNVAHHAGVDSARVFLHVELDEVYLSIRDEGRGFDPKLAMAREHDRERFGLLGMHERIAALGGECQIHSQAGQGTQVVIRVPANGRGAAHE